MLRTRVAGLVYQSVEYSGYTGSSALHVVAQIAELVGEIAELATKAENLSPESLEKLAEDVERNLRGLPTDSHARTH